MLSLYMRSILGIANHGDGVGYTHAQGDNVVIRLVCYVEDADMKQAYVIEVEEKFALEDIAKDLISAYDAYGVSAYGFKDTAEALRNAIPIGPYAAWEAKRDASVKEK